MTKSEALEFAALSVKRTKKFDKWTQFEFYSYLKERAGVYRALELKEKNGTQDVP